MVLKSDVVKERLQHMKKALGELNVLKKIKKDDFLQSVQLQWSIERGFQIVCEAVFDIGNHILVGNFDLAPSNYQSVIDMLVEKKVLSADLGKEFGGLGGFRNILVHDYMEVKPEEIYDKLQNRLGDFEMFIKEVVVWLQAR